MQTGLYNAYTRYAAATDCQLSGKFFSKMIVEALNAKTDGSVYYKEIAQNIYNSGAYSAQAEYNSVSTA
ncbi:MAG: hypothetical protein RLZZ19_367 [Actinomycetota bacterium]|jgi:hypothetical protein